ncbi:MAG TPA: hypothetical protein VKT77_03545 [Chthonomonadaceae bacterium]|nr:hypothetical protein [Chthonomonadaceae bacterium]
MRHLCAIALLLLICSIGECQSSQLSIQSTDGSGISVVVLYRKPDGHLTQAQIHVPSITVDSSGRISEFSGPVNSMTWLAGRTSKVIKSRLSGGKLLLTTSDHHNYVIYDLQSTMYGKMKDARRSISRRPKRTKK